MGVTFVYRCPYEGPSEKTVVHFADATVLDWFRSRWREMGARGHACGDMPGVDVYGFGSLGEAIADHDLPEPVTEDELRQMLDTHLYVEGEILFEDHCIQVLTDDDELGMAYYFFDDIWLEQYPDRAVFLTHEDWRLPEDIDPYAPPFSPQNDSDLLPGGPPGEGPEKNGSVFLLFNSYYDGSNLDGVSPLRIQGIRLDILPAWLMIATPTDEWPLELLFLRAQLFVPPQDTGPEERELMEAIVEDPASGPAWSVYSDWLLQRGKPAAHVDVLQRALLACAEARISEWAGDVWPRNDVLTGSLIESREEAAALLSQYGKKLQEHDMPLHLAASDHLAQMCIPAFPTLGTYHQWYFFDDLWATSHSALADGVMCYLLRWDVLTVEGL